jgi:hypothetical protein
MRVVSCVDLACQSSQSDLGRLTTYAATASRSTRSRIQIEADSTRLDELRRLPGLVRPGFDDLRALHRSFLKHGAYSH